MQVFAGDNDISSASGLRKAKQPEGFLRELDLRHLCERPLERHAGERAEAMRRYRKMRWERLARESR